MLKGLSIQGFRGLRDLTLTRSGRVNLIVGRNDTGKTTMLEAIRLLLTGDPRHMRRTNRNRIDRVPTNFEESFQLAFHRGDTEASIDIKGELESLRLQATATVESIDREERLLLEPDDVGESDLDESFLRRGKQVVVRITANDAQVATVGFPLEESVLRRTTVSTQRSFAGGEFPQMPPVTWLGTNRAESWSHARRYSRLADQRANAVLIELLARIEPQLKDVKVSVSPHGSMSAGAAVLKVDLGSGPLLPLESMGDGFASTIAIITAVASSQDGLCLIDEVENGIHYSILPSVWLSVAEAAQGYDAQVWATTHSLDCVAAAHEAFTERPNDLLLHRFARKQNGEIKVHTFDYPMLTQALESGLEVR